jgi:hypothetical protein
MSIQNVYYTFTDLDINDKLTFQFNKMLNYGLHSEICEEYKSEAITSETLKQIISDLKSARCGNMKSGKSYMLYEILDIIKKNDFNFLELYSDWCDEGSEDYVIYEYLDSSEVINSAKNEIENQIKILKKYGITTQVEYQTK